MLGDSRRSGGASGRLPPLSGGGGGELKSTLLAGSRALHMLPVPPVSALDLPHSPSPGPIYAVKHLGATGPQALSHVPTAPRPVFGTARRLPPLGVDDTPAPVDYVLPSEKGVAYSLRSRERFGTMSLGSAVDNPGPGAHSRIDTTAVRKANAPAFSIRPRRPGLPGDVTPGPGHSQRILPLNAFRPLSTAPNVPSIAFGTGGRGPVGERTGSGAVGPAEYGPVSVRPLSTKPSPPRYSLASRHAQPRASTAQAALRPALPGLGKQLVSHKPSAPAFTLAGRTRFCGFRQ